MKLRAGALIFVVVLFGASACGSARPASSHTGTSHTGTSHTRPSTNASYAWQPIAGGPSLVCSKGFRAITGMIDWKGHPFYCKLPSPVHRAAGAGIDFTGPTTVSATRVPLQPHQLRVHISFGAPAPAVLRVDFGDGSHWQRSVTPSPASVDVVHTYAPTPRAIILVTLRDKTGYLALEGIGPFRAPVAGPRTRYCAYIADGKGGRLSATPSLTCAQAKALFARVTYPHGSPPGYRCRTVGLPPWGSDAGVTTCTNGARAFLFTTNQ